MTMNSALLSTSTLLLPAAILLATQAQERANWERLSRRMDTDGNGEITREEFTRRAGLFRRLDRDRDGVLTAADFGAERAQPEAPSTGGAGMGTSEEDERTGLALFETEVKTILEDNCHDCHASGARRVRAGLKLDTRAALLEGGSSGPALVPGDPDHSLLVEVVRYADLDLGMPPSGPLAADEVAAIERWVAMGAPWPGEAVASGSDEIVPESSIDIEAGREWWAYQPVVKPTVPEPNDAAWGRSPIDAFLMQGMEAAGIEPVGDADRSAWLRRVTFDLTGLQPTPAELEAFERDRSEAAHEVVVDRLLGSPQYAERWGRHWLDVARYAESSGREANVVYPHAWRYRDWVIDAFARDLPYDEFLSQQLAGDLLPADGVDDEARQRIATGYLALGPKSHGERNPQQFAVDVVDEQIDAISQGMLGTTLACARCHDHKFDPLPTEDYYAMAGILGSTETLFGTYRGLGNRRASELFSISAQADVPNGPDLPPELRRAFQRRLEPRDEPSMGGMGEMEDERLARIRRRRSEETKTVLGGLLDRYDTYGKAKPSARQAMGAREGRARDAQLLVRGELDAVGPSVPRGFPQVLSSESTPQIGRRSSGRLELAEWVASEENPLTARVWVNRIWSNLFGSGIVASPDNFGTSGQAPSHPELLDWLAATFVEEDWSTRQLIRRIVLSRAYRLDTEGNTKNQRIDPQGKLLWRMPARRLEAEALRDAMLFAAGSLVLERPVGSPVAVLEGQQRREALLDRLTEDTGVRSVYLPILRDRVPHALECFDAADPSFVTGEREETVAATQALLLMNDEDVLEAADAFAERIMRAEKKTDARIELAFLLSLSREPSSSERSAVKRFLKDFERIVEQEGERRRPQRDAWSAFAQSLFQTAEFRFRG